MFWVSLFPWQDFLGGKGQEREKNPSSKMIFMAVFKRHSFSVGITSKILRLNIQNFSNQLVPRRVTAISQDDEKSE